MTSLAKREFVTPNNITIKITEPLAGTAADGSAAADEETVFALAPGLVLAQAPAVPMMWTSFQRRIAKPT